MIYSHKKIVYLANTLSESKFSTIYNKQKKAIEIAEKDANSNWEMYLFSKERGDSRAANLFINRYNALVRAIDGQLFT